MPANRGLEGVSPDGVRQTLQRLPGASLGSRLAHGMTGRLPIDRGISLTTIGWLNGAGGLHAQHGRRLVECVADLQRD